MANKFGLFQDKEDLLDECAEKARRISGKLARSNAKKSPEEVIRPSVNRPSDNISRPSDNSRHEVSRPSDNLSDNWSDNRPSVNRPSDNYQTTYQTPYQTPQINRHKTMSKNWVIVLYYMFIKKDRHTSYNEIATRTGVRPATVRHSVSCLFREGYISKPIKVCNRNFQGFSYITNDPECEELFEAWKETLPMLSDPLSDPLSDGLLTDGLISDPLVSKSFKDFKKLTNYSEEELKIIDAFENDTELDYWQGKITADKAIGWMREFEIDADSLLSSMRQFAFEMSEMGNPKRKGRTGTEAGYFYKAMKGSKLYFVPEYKSPKERDIEAKEAALKAKEELARRDMEVIEATELQRADRFFLDMMENPDSELYQRCLERVMPLVKECGGKTFTRDMRRHLDAIIEEESKWEEGEA